MDQTFRFLSHIKVPIIKVSVPSFQHAVDQLVAVKGPSLVHT